MTNVIARQTYIELESVWQAFPPLRPPALDTKSLRNQDFRPILPTGGIVA